MKLSQLHLTFSHLYIINKMCFTFGKNQITKVFITIHISINLSRFSSLKII